MKKKRLLIGGLISAFVLAIIMVGLYNYNYLTGFFISQPATIDPAISSQFKPAVSTSVDSGNLNLLNQEITYYDNDKLIITRSIIFGQNDNFTAFILEENIPQLFELCSNFSLALFKIRKTGSNYIETKIENKDAQGQELTIPLYKYDLKQEGKNFSLLIRSDKERMIDLITDSIKYLISYQVCSKESLLRHFSQGKIYYQDKNNPTGEISEKSTPRITFVPGINAEIKQDYLVPEILTDKQEGIIKLSIKGKNKKKPVDGYLFDLQISFLGDTAEYNYKGTKTNLNFDFSNLDCSKIKKVNFELTNPLLNRKAVSIDCNKAKKGGNVKIQLSFKKAYFGLITKKLYPARCSISYCGIILGQVNQNIRNQEIPFFAIAKNGEIIYLPEGDYTIVYDSGIVADRTEKVIEINKDEWKGRSKDYIKVL